MRSRWIRTLAVLLVVSLLAGSTPMETGMTVYATESGDSDNLIEDTDDSTEETEEEPEQEPEEETEEEPEQEPEEEIEEEPEQEPEEETEEEPEQEPEEEIEEEPETDTEEEAEDEEELDGESSEEQNYAVMLLDADTGDGTDNRVGLPENADEYEAYDENNTVYVFSSAEDYLKLQEHSKENSFEGVAFRIGNLGTDTIEIDQNFLPGFEGFGTEEHPFKGSIAFDYDAGSAGFALYQPLFSYVGSGAEIYNFMLNCKEGIPAAITKHILFEEGETEPVFIHDLEITGVVKNADGVVGTIAGTISDDAIIKLENVNSSAEEISGKIAGGIAGQIGKDVTVTASETTLSGTVVGAQAAGGYYGTITGSHDWNASENSLGDGLQVSCKNDGYVGAFAGKLCKGAEDTVLTIGSDSNIVVNARVSGTGNSGGLIGVCEEDTTLMVEEPLTISGSVSGSTAGGLTGLVSEAFVLNIDNFVCSATVSGSENAGGLFGKITADEFLTEANAASDAPELQVTGTIKSADGYAGAYAGTVSADIVMPEMVTQSSTTISAGIGAGGVLGRLAEGSRGIVCGAKIGETDGDYDGGNISAKYAGGVAGVIEEGAALELQDVFVLHPTLTGNSYRGSVIGKQEKALVYLSEPVNSGNRTEQLLFDNSTGCLSEVGTYGGLFRNQKTESDGCLIGDGTLEKVGEISDDYVSGSNGTYTLEGTNGLFCLAVALQTQGNFAMEAFGFTSGTDAGNDGVEVLLSGDFTVSEDADISYDKTGIITLNRNDKENDDGGNYTFKGSLRGESEGTVITQNSRTYPDGIAPWWEAYPACIGLFSTISGSDNVFSNLCIEGNVQYARGAGGIAYRSIGDGLKLENIEMRKVFSNMDGGSAIGGILAKEESAAESFAVDANHVTLGAEIYPGQNTEFGGFIVTAEKMDVALRDIVLAGVLKSELTENKSIGGFLGKSWKYVSGYIGGTDADEGVRVEDGTVFYAASYFGGLLDELYTRDGQYITLQNIDLDGLTVDINANAAGKNSHSALLIRMGRGMAANIVDYSCSGCIVKNAGSRFDEVVGSTNNNGNNTSGIVSLHSTSADFPQYHYEEQATYVNRTTKVTSDARYFYDVFQILEKEKAAQNAGTKKKINEDPITTAEEMLLWSTYYNVNTYENGSRIQNVFVPYLNLSGTYTISGEIDLSGVSFYPMPNRSNVTLKGQDGAKLIFDASNMDTWSIPNNLKSGIKFQHYGLHSGLFLNATALTVSDICLSGTVANRGTESGALVAGTLAGDSSFSGIVLDDLWIDNYTGGDDYGLLISYISADNSDTKQDDTVDVLFGSSTLAGVKMTGYSSGSGKLAAAALIGKAGSSSMTNLRLDFRNMQVADEKNGGETHNGSAFARASYICTYRHTSNADAYTGRCWYLFTKEEADNALTYGAEIDSETEYWWEDTENDDPHERVVDDIKLRDSDFEPADYLPYVYQEELIEVNPKPGDISLGCGTYEDPYMIETRIQFLTLYRYLNMTKENSTEAADTAFFKDWKINKIGNDESVCDKNHTEADLQSFGDDEFPTQAELRGAYYQLANDIDMSGMTSGNYKTIADNFVGFGTKEYPFTGVWYGKDEGGTVHTITLPSKSTTRVYDSFGLIQYAKGVVIKDMIIKSAEDSTDIEEGRKKIITRISGNGMAGSVIGCVLGGDNIIDGVTVDTEFAVENYTNASGTKTNYLLAAVGGYVGCVKKGGLILRNVEIFDTDDFAVYDSSVNLVTDSAGKAFYCGAAAGRVEDGYILHEDGNADSALWEQGSTGGEGNYPLVPDYAIVDGDYLESQTAGVSISAPDGEGRITAELPNSAALLAFSMAMNADALNVRPETASEQGATPKTYGYTAYSRSRKADYSAIGCGSRADSASSLYESDCETAYKAAVMYDNKNAAAYEQSVYPYLYQYLNIGGADAAGFIKEGNGILNPAGVIDGIAYHTTWKLTGSTDYDMSAFGEAFRGIGALYDLEDGYGGTLRGNFDGNGKTVKLDRKSLARNVSRGDEKLCPDSLRSIGLFNTLYQVKDEAWYEENGVTIQNLKITGVACVEKDAAMSVADGSLPTDVGGVVGRIENLRVSLSEIEVENLSINAGIVNTQYSETTGKKGCFGGLAGTVTGRQKLTITDCVVKNDEKPVSDSDSNVMKGIGFGGGFVGVVGNSVGTTAVQLAIVGSGILAENLYIKSGQENAGGLIGHAAGTGSLEITGGTNAADADNRLCVQKCTVHSFWNAGGVVGESAVTLTASGVTANKVLVYSYKGTGGIVGCLSETKTSTLENIGVYDSTIEEAAAATTLTTPYNAVCGQGGIVGINGQVLSITGAEVAATSDTAVCTVKSVNNIRMKSASVECQNGVGGIVGYHNANNLTLADCKADGISVTGGKAESLTGNDNNTSIVCVGGIVGFGNSNLILQGDYVHVEDSVISSVEPAHYNGGNYFAAGGCFGFVRNVVGKSWGLYRGLSSVNNTIKGKEAGGIFGVATANTYLAGRSTVVSDEIPGGMTVSGCNIRGVECAGGLFGEIRNSGAVSINDANSTKQAAAANPKIKIEGLDIAGKYVGGAAGCVRSSDNIRLENLYIRDCRIAGETLTDADNFSDGSCMGGVIGFYRTYKVGGYTKLYHLELEDNEIVYESEEGELNDREADSLSGNSNSYIAVGGILGRIYRPTQEIKASVYADYIVLKQDNVIGVRQSGTDEIKLVQDDKLADVVMPTVSADMSRADAAEELAEEYGYYVGTLVGVCHGEEISTYMMHVSNTDGDDAPPILAQANAPVTDVGRIPGTDLKSYRDKVHIIYGTADSETNFGEENLAAMDGFVSEAEASYNGSESLQDIERIYRLPKELNWVEAYSMTGTVSGSVKKLPVLMCKPGVVSLDEQIKLFADIMTNVSGLSSAKMEILSVTQKQVAWDLTNDSRTVTVPTEETAHILITQDNDFNYSFAYNGTNCFDTYVGDLLTYTELTFEYKYDSSHIRRFVLPVFVEEPLLLDIQAKMLAGRVNSVSEMASGISDTATIANDSDYSLLLDFSYGNARARYDRMMEKHIYLTNTQGIKQFEEGTRLLLIDITNGNKPYYYTVTKDSPEKIPFCAFTDTGEAVGTDGAVAYEEQSISRLVNADGATAYDGHDMYLLQVLPGVKGENTIYDIRVGFSEIDDTNKNSYSMEGITEAVITADAIPGLQFQLLEAGARDNLLEPQQGTAVSGELSENGMLTLDMEYCIKMDPAYRAKENPMDSANNDKYLELACYLTDEDGKRIAFPDGTNIQYVDADKNVVTKSITDYASVYYYKDVAESQYMIRGDSGITDTVQVPLQIQLKLPDDISVLDQDTYTVHIDLLRTDDPEYPSGYEDALDTYERSVGAEAIPKLGFAVTVSEEDWSRLGVNTYSYDTEFTAVDENGVQIHEIPFRMQIDFRSLLKQLSGGTIEAEWAAKDYYVTYRLFGKGTDGNYPTVTFTDGGTTITPETFRIAAKGGKDADGNDNVFCGNDAVAEDAYAVGSDGSLKIKYRFTEEEIHKNADELLQKGTPIEREGKVMLNMEQLKGLDSKEELERYLTNYKMEAVLQITERDVEPSEIGTEDTTDFFVFTVTRLKTDIE